MASSTTTNLFPFLLPLLLASPALPANRPILTEYIGAKYNNVKFTDIPITTPNIDVQFLSPSPSTTPPLLTLNLVNFNSLSLQYAGGKLLASFGTDTESECVKPEKGFFRACQRLKAEGKLHGIAIGSVGRLL